MRDELFQVINQKDVEQSTLYWEYEKKISKKLEKIVGQIELLERANSQQKLEELRSYFREERRCKLPWSLIEVNDAIEKMIALVNAAK